MKKQSSTLAHPAQRIFLTALLCAACGYLMSRLHGLIPLDKPVMPIALMATFALPGTLSISLINSLNGIKKLKGLNREEKRRIDSIASRKVHRQIFLIVIYLLLSAGMGVAFFAATLPAVAPYLKHVLAAVGAALAFAVVCSVFAVIDSSELASFEAKISNRSAERKAKQALLKRLASKE